MDIFVVDVVVASPALVLERGGTRQGRWGGSGRKSQASGFCRRADGYDVMRLGARRGRRR